MLYKQHTLIYFIALYPFHTIHFISSYVDTHSLLPYLHTITYTNTKRMETSVNSDKIHPLIRIYRLRLHSKPTRLAGIIRRILEHPQHKDHSSDHEQDSLTQSQHKQRKTRSLGYQLVKLTHLSHHHVYKFERVMQHIESKVSQHFTLHPLNQDRCVICLECGVPVKSYCHRVCINKLTKFIPHLLTRVQVDITQRCILVDITHHVTPEGLIKVHHCVHHREHQGTHSQTDQNNQGHRQPRLTGEGVEELNRELTSALDNMFTCFKDETLPNNTQRLRELQTELIELRSTTLEHIAHISEPMFTSDSPNKQLFYSKLILRNDAEPHKDHKHNFFAKTTDILDDLDLLLNSSESEKAILKHNELNMPEKLRANAKAVGNKALQFISGFMAPSSPALEQNESLVLQLENTKRAPSSIDQDTKIQEARVERIKYFGVSPMCFVDPTLNNIIVNIRQLVLEIEIVQIWMKLIESCLVCDVQYWGPKILEYKIVPSKRINFTKQLSDLLEYFRTVKDSKNANQYVEQLISIIIAREIALSSVLEHIQNDVISDVAEINLRPISLLVNKIERQTHIITTNFFEHNKVWLSKSNYIISLNNGLQNDYDQEISRQIYYLFIKSNLRFTHEDLINNTLSNQYVFIWAFKLIVNNDKFEKNLALHSVLDTPKVTQIFNIMEELFTSIPQAQNLKRRLLMLWTHALSLTCDGSFTHDQEEKEELKLFTIANNTIRIANSVQSIAEPELRRFAQSSGCYATSHPVALRFQQFLNSSANPEHPSFDRRKYGHLVGPDLSSTRIYHHESLTGLNWFFKPKSKEKKEDEAYTQLLKGSPVQLFIEECHKRIDKVQTDLCESISETLNGNNFRVELQLIVNIFESNISKISDLEMYHKYMCTFWVEGFFMFIYNNCNKGLKDYLRQISTRINEHVSLVKSEPKMTFIPVLFKDATIRQETKECYDKVNSNLQVLLGTDTLVVNKPTYLLAQQLGDDLNIDQVNLLKSHLGDYYDLHERLVNLFTEFTIQATTYEQLCKRLQEFDLLKRIKEVENNAGDLIKQIQKNEADPKDQTQCRGYFITHWYMALCQLSQSILQIFPDENIYLNTEKGTYEQLLQNLNLLIIQLPADIGKNCSSIRTNTIFLQTSSPEILITTKVLHRIIGFTVYNLQTSTYVRTFKNDGDKKQYDIDTENHLQLLTKMNSMILVQTNVKTCKYKSKQIVEAVFKQYQELIKNKKNTLSNNFKYFWVKGIFTYFAALWNIIDIKEWLSKSTNTKYINQPLDLTNDNTYPQYFDAQLCMQTRRILYVIYSITQPDDNIIKMSLRYAQYNTINIPLHECQQPMEPDACKILYDYIRFNPYRNQDRQPLTQ